ncbi:MAG: hypothetical protein NTU95_05345 [Methanothrix sp.]|nr:hypothetical protein [Methanothrix sp.]
MMTQIVLTLVNLKYNECQSFFMIFKGEEIEAPSPGGKRLDYVNQNRDEQLTTGICGKPPVPYNIQGEVLPTLGKLDFGVWDADFWSCHERALKGIAYIRYKYPGCRTAIALGLRGKDDHSLIVLWDGAGNDWHYYDSTGINGNTILSNDEFTGTKIVNFPPPGIANNSGDVPGFGGFQKKDTGFLVLNPTYTVDDKANFMKALNALSDQIASDHINKKKYPAPAGVNQAFFDGHFVVHDRVLLECMKLRETFKKFPIGMAFGKLTFKKGKDAGKAFDYATLVFWNGPNSPPIYWGLNAKNLINKVADLEFVPRMVIV